jgi:zinc and cadmium transporter
MDALIAACAIALISFSGALVLGDHTTKRSRAFFEPFLPLSIGAFLGVVFFELLPEAFHESEYASVAITVGFLGFFLLSRLIREYHHHHTIGVSYDAEHTHDSPHHHTRQRGALILLGDGVHNVADGIVIAVAFSVSTALGLATTLGIALHEIPQEIAEYYLLRSVGYTKWRALTLNGVSALGVIVGTALTLLLGNYIEDAVGILIGIAAGNLLYIAASDLLPSLSDQRVHTKVFIRHAMYIFCGIVAIATLMSLSHTSHIETDVTQSDHLTS